MAKKTNQKRRGRPKGSTNASRDVVAVLPSHCRQCGSTDREAYIGKPIVREITGTVEGRPYNKITWRRTRCANCGQARVDQTFELTATAEK